MDAEDIMDTVYFKENMNNTEIAVNNQKQKNKQVKLCEQTMRKKGL